MDCMSEETRKQCTCTYTSCENRGNCCKCVVYHKDRGEIPGCFFSAKAESSYDRSLSSLVRDRGLF